MNIIFLDCDGVLNCANNDGMVEARFRERFNRLIETTGAKAVLISTWRKNPQWRELLKQAELADCFIDATPILNKPRIEEIKAWLAEHPEVTKYAIIDDNMQGMFGLPIYVPDAEFGLMEHTLRLITNYFK